MEQKSFTYSDFFKDTYKLNFRLLNTFCDNKDI